MPNACHSAGSTGCRSLCLSPDVVLRASAVTSGDSPGVTTQLPAHAPHADRPAVSAADVLDVGSSSTSPRSTDGHPVRQRRSSMGWTHRSHHRVRQHEQMPADHVKCSTSGHECRQQVSKVVLHQWCLLRRHRCDSAWHHMEVPMSRQDGAQLWM